jgi:hypothetical protein
LRKIFSMPSKNPQCQTVCTIEERIARAMPDRAPYIGAIGRFGATSDSTVHAGIEALRTAVARHAKNSVKSVAAMTEFVLPWLLEEGKTV